MFSQFEMNKKVKNINNTKTKPTDKENMSTATAKTDAMDNEKIVMPSLQYVKKKPDYSHMKKDLLKALSEERYEEIELYMKNKYPLPAVKAFFKKDGESVFDYVILDAESSVPFKFLLQIVPKFTGKDILLSILKGNQYYILNGFLGAQKVKEKLGRLIKDKKVLAIEKINALLELEDEEISTFIYTNMPDSLKEVPTKKQGFENKPAY